jgi:hypothetical protein
VAALQKREEFLALRLGAPAGVRPEALCSQGQFDHRVGALESPSCAPDGHHCTSLV